MVNKKFSKLDNISLIISHAAKVVIPFMIAFGIYIQVSSHDSPGGGFQAGAILASVFILYALVFGIDSALSKLSFQSLLNLSAGGILIYALAGILSVLRRKAFLDYGIFDNQFINGRQIGIFIVEIGVGLTVFSTVCMFYTVFIRGKA